MRLLTPPPAAAHAGDIDFIVGIVHLLMLALFVGWGTSFVYVLVRFRSGRQPRADVRGATGRWALATAVGVVCAEGALLVIALPIWFTQTSAPPADSRAVVVRVVAEQFAWNVHYPGPDGRFGTTSPRLISPNNPLGLDRASPFGRDDIVDLGALHLPIGRQAVIQLSSKDVIHSFGAQAMRVKQDVVPGHLSSVWFTPTERGEFEIACSQLCGLAHYRMRGVITVETEEEFRKYLER